MKTSHKNTKVPLNMFTIFANARLRDEKKRLKMTGTDVDCDQGELNDQKGSFFLHKTFTPQDHGS